MVSVVGAFVATAAVITGSLPTLVLGTLLIGFGNSSNQLSRYAAADLVPPGRRASTLGLAVWGATVGAVVGPNLVAFSGEVALNRPDKFRATRTGGYADVELVSVEETIRRVRAVTEEDVTEAAASLFALDRLSAAGIGPRETRFRAAIARVNPALDERA